jgi:CRP/FNR family transcriptional regulator, cyclic AMP receptor protein
MANLKEQLLRVDVFAGLPAATVDGLVTRGSTITFPAGGVIVQEGATESGFQLLLSGSADVSIAGQVVNALSAGDYFGEISLIDGAPRSATVTATAPSKTFRISPLQFHEIVDEDPAALRALLVCVTGRLRSAQGS